MASMFSLEPTPNTVIVINVGGVLHTTTNATLARYPHSMLASMFSGRYTPSLLHDSSGHVFIDRDGDLFRIVLNFLRTSRLCLPSGFEDFALLEVESDFYQVPELTGAVRECLEEARSKETPPLAGYFLEVIEFEESAYFSRFYMTPPSRQCNGSFKSGGLVVSGHRDALSTLPLQSRTLETSLADVEALSTEASGDNKNFHKIFASNSDKLPLFHHLSQTGWKLLNSSFNYGADNDGSYIVHKYIWQYPLSGSTTNGFT